MTMHRRDSCHQDEFRHWVQANPRLDSVRKGLVITDFDLLFHKYKSHIDRQGNRDVQHMMIVEYKRYCAKLPETQRDTLGMFHQIFRTKTRMVKSVLTGKLVRLRFWGCHVLRMDGAGPEDSRHMIWDRTRINVYDLECILRFDIDPIRLRPLEDRRHHTLNCSASKQKELV